MYQAKWVNGMVNPARIYPRWGHVLIMPLLVHIVCALNYQLQ